MTLGDDQQIRALIQGALYGFSYWQRTDGVRTLRDIVSITEVEQHVNDHGDYEHYYTIVTTSGHRIRVTVEVE